MPVVRVWEAGLVVVLKRSMGSVSYAGMDTWVRGRVGFRVRARARVRARISSTRYAGMDQTLTRSHSPLTGELRGHGQPCLLQREHRHAPRRRQVFVRRAAGRPRLTARGPRLRRRNVTRASLLVGGAPAAHKVFGRVFVLDYGFLGPTDFLFAGRTGTPSRPWGRAHRYTRFCVRLRFRP